MVTHLADSLLALAAAIDGDGGQGVCHTLSALLRDTAPFDAGEVVLRHGDGFHRYPFGTDERPVAGDDLVSHVLAGGAPLRLDDARDLEPFPDTRERMAQGGFKSALVLPLGTVLHVQAPHHAASPNGVLVLARRHGWAFVGASLHFLGPVAAMAGMALDRSLALTALGHPKALAPGADPQPGESLRQEGASLIAELQKLRAASATSDREVVALRSSLAVARDELADSRGATIAAQSALDQAVSRCHALEARLEHEGHSASKGEAGPGEGPPGEPAPALDAPQEARMPDTTDTDGTVEAAGTHTPATESGAAAEAAVDEGAAEPGIAEDAAQPAMAGPATAEPPAFALASDSGLSRRARRRRRKAFEPSGGAGAA
jgi:hypothetical protein